MSYQRNIYHKLFSGNFRDIDPHQLVYELMSKRTPGTVKATVAKNVRWAQYAHNAKAATFLDRVFHFLGYKNGVFTNFIAPVQLLLEDIESCDADDKADHQEDLSSIVRGGLQEAEESFKSMLKTGSPFASFPNKGLSLLHVGSNYYAERAALETDLDGAVTTDARWRRKAARRSKLDEKAAALEVAPPPQYTLTLPFSSTGGRPSCVSLYEHAPTLTLPLPLTLTLPLVIPLTSTYPGLGPTSTLSWSMPRA